MKIVITKTGASLALAGALLFAAPTVANAATPSIAAVAAPVTAAGEGDVQLALPATGIDAGALLGYWVGGGALALTVATVALAATIRRNRATHDA